jgi:hypothetical protein
LEGEKRNSLNQLSIAMKTMICSLLARILFDQPDFDFLEYSGLNFGPENNSIDSRVPLRRVAALADH